MDGSFSQSFTQASLLRYNQIMVSARQISDYTKRMVQRFEPRTVILFGSRAYGKPMRDSDVDLLVIMPFRGHPLDAALRVLKAVPPSFALDLIVRQPADIARRYREFDPLTARCN